MAISNYEGGEGNRIIQVNNVDVVGFLHFESLQYSAEEQHTYREKILFVRNVNTSHYSDSAIAWL